LEADLKSLREGLQPGTAAARALVDLEKIDVFEETLVDDGGQPLRHALIDELVQEPFVVSEGAGDT
jgi:hypothetical protein